MAFDDHGDDELDDFDGDEDDDAEDLDEGDDWDDDDPERPPAPIEVRVFVDLSHDLSDVDVNAAIAAAAAEAPTVRRDGSFLFAARGRCRRCGCTDDRACPGGCIWAAPDLCSRCARAGFADWRTE